MTVAAGQIQKNAAKIVKDCCNVKPGDRVVIVTDSEQSPIVTQALFNSAVEAQASPILIQMEKARPGAPLPEAVNAALKEANIIISPTTTSIYHSAGVREACENHGARLLALSECTEDLMCNGGINADFSQLKPVVDTVFQYYDNGKHIHYITEGGTNITASIEGRPAYKTAGLCHAPGEKIGMPTVEVFIAPIEESVNGKVVVDLSCSGGVGVIQEQPICLTIENGKVTNIEGGSEALKLKQILESSGTDSVYQIAELAIGLNPDCRITGNIVEDEGKYGTCHMALGSNAGFGGKSAAPLHIDMVQNNPTITIDDVVITKKGVLQVADMSSLLN